MTDLRPEREGRSYEPSREADGPYDREAFEAAVGRLDDPLTDPLPGRPPAREPRPGPGRTGRPQERPAGAERPAQPVRSTQHAQTSQPGQPGRSPQPGGPAQSGQPASGRSGSPWFRPHQAPVAPPAQQQGQVHGRGSAIPGPDQAPAPPYGQAQAPIHVPAPNPAPHPAPDAAPHPVPSPGANPTPPPGPVAASAPAPADPTADPFLNPVLDPPYVPGPVGTAGPDPAHDAETMALRQAAEPVGDHGGPDVVSRETEPEAPASGSSASTPPVTGGRAARRKAAQEAAKRGNRRARRGSPSGGAGASSSAAEAPSVPMTRMEARRAERAGKESPGIIVSRAVGEVFITLGVLMLLFVTYQLWWTNVLAHQQAGGTASNLEQEWDEGGEDRRPDAFSPGQGFAIMYIPKLDVKVPIAEGISKPAVLDRGMIGHYDKNSVKTAMPWDKQGNFAVAGHRNTHGEPFRYINKLVKGDKIVVETRSTYYTYTMESILPQTSPRDIAVLDPVPRRSGFTRPGRYLTLTTCTPEFTSTFRMIVWGKMVEERPRSKGKPDALVS
ncbi:class E sortase [Streptomyces sp. NPDC039022]|uniref:class E sortase n=1 Tax=Streptomyces sp. NPDC039022 TaxID=3157091 RepID=UPI0033DD3834